MTKKTALVICPGRGTYNKPELGYLARHHADKSGFIGMVDAFRAAQGQVPVSALDSAARYSIARHTSGDNASPLIYACSYADFLGIDREAWDIVAVTGNSMGWYIALACGGAVDAGGGMEIVNTMGTLMQETLIGGQLIYPLVDANWQEISGRREELMAKMAEVNADLPSALFISIELGGLMVFAGTSEALKVFEARLEPEQERYPMRLQNHAAFHTPLQQPVAAAGQARLGADLFSAPAIPLIDGRGSIWWPFSSEPEKLRDYTLQTQVVETYDFTKAVQVGVKEFAPDALIITGPGTTLGGAVAQCLIDMEWQGLRSKSDFLARQKSDQPVIHAMGMDGQRAGVVSVV